MSVYDFEVGASGGTGPNVVILGGELDLTNARELEERFEALDADRALVIDLDRVTFVDSAALHVIFKLVRSRHASPPAFVLDPASRIARTLAIVKLDDVARVAASLEELGPSHG
jgi:anti-anti-sigma factor